MAYSGHERCIFPLKSLQIGDMQSYFSHLSLFLATESGKVYILVENRPWLKNHMSRSVHWWQLMVTKSRLSPFVNTRVRKEEKIIKELSELHASSSSDARKSRNYRKWFAFTDVVLFSRKRALLPVRKLRNSLIANSELHRILCGFIVFEVAWRDVRGINYLNELQTDTSLAIEAKFMRRWEFDDIAEAARRTPSWFPGTVNEHVLLKEHFDATIGEVYQDAQERFPWTTKADNNGIINDDLCAGDESSCSPNCTFTSYLEAAGNGQQTPTSPDSSPNKRRKVMRSIYCGAELGFCSDESDAEAVEVHSQTSDPRNCEETLEATLYRNVLILFRFNDPYLPFKLRDIIMSELWLLTLLEAGLPSWAIFLQSYPGFSRLYRPWMCPLARALYMLISFVTVAIGFYDLYKNIPLLKATASHLFGPLLDWIEAWEMVSRIKYLGTMLFLNNFQKAIKCFLVLMRTILSFLSFFIVPMVRPFTELLECFLPLLSNFIQLAEDFFSVTWMVVVSSFKLVGDLLEVLLLPPWHILLAAWNVATSLIYPVLWVVFYAPFKLVLGLCNIMGFLCTFIYNFLGALWLSTRSIFRLTKGVESTVSSYDVSIWRSLWNDLFSQVFRALRSILNGFVAFFTACNRHRLSIYNHVKEFIHRLLCATKRAWSKEDSHSARRWKNSHYQWTHTKSI